MGVLPATPLPVLRFDETPAQTIHGGTPEADYPWPRASVEPVKAGDDGSQEGIAKWQLQGRASLPVDSPAQCIAAVEVSVTGGKTWHPALCDQSIAPPLNNRPS
jgi:hypothetical protein|eukprot:COSAG01_NODE_9672_length_2373_cov_1.393580_1_plen_104_part_00